MNDDFETTWPNWNAMPASAWREWEPQKTPIKIACVPAEFRTDHLAISISFPSALCKPWQLVKKSRDADWLAGFVLCWERRDFSSIPISKRMKPILFQCGSDLMIYHISIPCCPPRNSIRTQRRVFPARCQLYVLFVTNEMLDMLVCTPKRWKLKLQSLMFGI
jgi:hypothetical protein